MVPHLVTLGLIGIDVNAHRLASESIDEVDHQLNHRVSAHRGHVLRKGDVSPHHPDGVSAASRSRGNLDQPRAQLRIGAACGEPGSVELERLDHLDMLKPGSLQAQVPGNRSHGIRNVGPGGVEPAPDTPPDRDHSFVLGDLGRLPQSGATDPEPLKQFVFAADVATCFGIQAQLRELVRHACNKGAA